MTGETNNFDKLQQAEIFSFFLCPRAQIYQKDFLSSQNEHRMSIMIKQFQERIRSHTQLAIIGLVIQIYCFQFFDIGDQQQRNLGYLS